MMPLRRVRLKLSTRTWQHNDLHDVDTGYHIGGDVLLNTENMHALLEAARKGPPYAECELTFLVKPPHIGPDGDVVTRRERVRIVEVVRA